MDPQIWEGEAPSDTGSAGASPSLFGLHAVP